MKGRSFIPVFFAILALLFTSFPGFSKIASNSVKISTKNKQVKGSLQEVPEPGSGLRYSVKKGDNLIGIARKFGTTPEELKTANNLRSSRIKAGQFLQIPGPETAEPEKDRSAPEAVRTRSAISMSAAGKTIEELEQDTELEDAPARLRLVKAGFELIGVRYRFSGTSEKSGFDCSGLVKTLFSKFNIDLPRSSKEQFRQGEKVDRDALEPGDLVFFSSGGSQPTHVGIYVGDNKFLHAARKARRVIVSDLNKIWYTVRYLGARRVMDLGEDPAPAQQ